ncbi:hypothetical protein [Halocola ammonii]
MKKAIYLLVAGAALWAGCNGSQSSDDNTASQETEANEVKEEEQDSIPYIFPEEQKYFKSLRKLTAGGDNAEAYYSFDDSKFVFQATNPEWGAECDQIFVMDISEGAIDQEPKMVSTGKGRTTCSYFLPGDTTVIYASTHLEHDKCPPVPERKEGGAYVWPIYEEFDIFTADLDGNIVNQLTDTPGYDAEATVSPQGDKIVFTSMRSGDLELYTMNIDGSNVQQVTDELGYDGGAFFSPDGTKLVFRTSRPKTDAEIKKYKDLLDEGLVEPTNMEIYVCNVDGSDMQQVTDLGQANWAPFFHPSGEKIVFSSNHESKRGFPFNLYMINVDGTGLEKISHSKTFDAFPVFSNDGKHLVFSSNRNNGGNRSTNLFIAEWKEGK